VGISGKFINPNNLFVAKTYLLSNLEATNQKRWNIKIEFIPKMVKDKFFFDAC
jgi:hypothetical protein